MDTRKEIEKEPDRFQNTLDLDPISESMQKRIQRGKDQIRNGKTKTKAEVAQRFDHWLCSK